MNRTSHAQSVVTRTRWAAFTLVELLVVIVIIALVLGIAVPTFSAQLASTRRSLAENSVQTAITVARDLAVRDAGGDAAAVFFFDPEGGTRIVPMVQVNRTPFYDDDLAGGDRVGRDVFAALPGAKAINLPQYLNVRGLVTRGSFGPAGVNRPDQWALEQWYGRSYADTNARTQRQWVLPETGFYDTDLQTDMPDNAARSTFMVRFERGTGRLLAQSLDAIVLDPRPSLEDRDSITSARRGADAWKRVDRATNQADWAREVLERPETNNLTNDDKVELLGSVSNDTALARPVTRIAVYDERALANAVGARRLNPQTRSLLNPFEDWQNNRVFDQRLFQGAVPRPNDTSLANRITQWIEGDTNGDGQLTFSSDGRDPDRPDAKMYAIPAYAGDLKEIRQ